MIIAIAIILAMVARAQSLHCYDCEDVYLEEGDFHKNDCEGNIRQCTGKEVCSTLTLTFLTYGSGRPVYNYMKGYSCTEKAAVDSECDGRESGLAEIYGFTDFTCGVATCYDDLCNSKMYRAPDECVDKADENGSDYRGTVSVTASGHVCQRWDSQSPNKHSRTPEAEAYSDSGLQKNYCRNPDGESGAWCYNAEGTVPRWELCDIPTCIVNSASPFRTVDSNGGQVAAGTEGILLYNDMLVCDDGFSNNSATVICRNMGFGGSKSWRSEDDIGIPSNYDIGLDEVRCKNNYDLGSCTSETSHDCVRMESVRLVCE
ncbi:plasminogen-like isoform X3 [Bolinopsis microptera]|uniref:plasminogen-like isoform X3 n=1 Tax=Bolinopsis microptera TaxID=2820187 RepID=UPI00307A717A